MMKLFIVLGSLNMFLAVGLGAFGAHALKARLEESGYLAVYQTGVQYHLIHGLGLIAVALVAERLGAPLMLNWSGWLMVLGIVFFSGSLYVLSLSGVKVLGAITPIGGVMFLASWVLLAWTAWKSL